MKKKKTLHNQRLGLMMMLKKLLLILVPLFQRRRRRRRRHHSLTQLQPRVRLIKRRKRKSQKKNQKQIELILIMLRDIPISLIHFCFNKLPQSLNKVDLEVLVEDLSN
jgi:hypothetical protein